MASREGPLGVETITSAASTLGTPRAMLARSIPCKAPNNSRLRHCSDSFIDSSYNGAYSLASLPSRPRIYTALLLHTHTEDLHCWKLQSEACVRGAKEVAFETSNWCVYATRLKL